MDILINGCTCVSRKARREVISKVLPHTPISLLTFSQIITYPVICIRSFGNFTYFYIAGISKVIQANYTKYIGAYIKI